ncbi:MAG: hypothetical protein JRG96_08310 [Deltaproteobacteria bacterium]|nr:hypothetical protein [Deltaproteobacteria bacterium]
MNLTNSIACVGAAISMWCGPAQAGAPEAVQPEPGDIIVLVAITGSPDPTLLHVDPVTGTQTAIATGTPIDEGSIVAEVGGTVLFANRNSGLLRIHPSTGQSSVVAPVGLERLAIDSFGNAFGYAPIYQTPDEYDLIGYQVIRVDPADGSSQVVNPLMLVPSFTDFEAFALEPDGTALMATDDEGLGSPPELIRVSRLGELSSLAIVSELVWLNDAAVDAAGDILAAGRSSAPSVLEKGGLVVRVNPDTGTTTPINAGAPFQQSTDDNPSMQIAIEPDGTVLVADEQSGVLVRMDPQSGEAEPFVTLTEVNGVYDVSIVPAPPRSRALTLERGDIVALGHVGISRSLLVHIDPTTGEQTPLNAGNLLDGGESLIAVESDGRILTASWDGYLQRWDPALTESSSLTSLGEGHFVYDLAVERGGTILLSGSIAGEEHMGALLQEIDPASGVVTALNPGNRISDGDRMTVGADGRIFVGTSAGEIIRYDRDLAQQEPFATLMDAGEVNDLSLDVDGDLLALADDPSGEDRSLAIDIDYATGAQTPIDALDPASDAELAVVTVDGALIAGTGDGVLYRVDREAGTQVLFVILDNIFELEALAVVPEPSSTGQGIAALTSLVCLTRLRRSTHRPGAR